MARLPRLRAVRERAALTQRELAAKAGISQVQLSRIEAHGVDAYPSTARKLATALGVRPADLMAPESGEQ